MCSSPGVRPGRKLCSMEFCSPSDAWDKECGAAGQASVLLLKIAIRWAAWLNFMGLWSRFEMLPPAQSQEEAIEPEETSRFRSLVLPSLPTTGGSLAGR